MTYSINFESVRALIETMAGIKRNIDDTLNRVEEDSAKSLSQWNSEAKDAYEAAKCEWRNSANAMAPLLDNARSALSDIHDLYKRAEVAGANTFQKK